MEEKIWNVSYTIQNGDKNIMGFAETVKEYWPQITAMLGLFVILVTMKVDIDVLKEKVATIFKLWNDKK